MLYEKNIYMYVFELATGERIHVYKGGIYILHMKDSKN